MCPALSGSPACPGIEDQQDSDEILRILRHQGQAGMVHIHLTGQNILFKLDRVPECQNILYTTISIEKITKYYM